jgi:hypothetical protein
MSRTPAQAAARRGRYRDRAVQFRQFQALRRTSYTVQLEIGKLPSLVPRG